MASAAEQLAANFNWASFTQASELKKRIWFTLALLLVYRLGTYIPVPGINPDELARVFAQNQAGIVGMFNMFSGGAVGRMAIFALNILPYITASIIIQLLSATNPHLEQLKKEGERGRQQINQYTRYGTVLIATMHGYGIAVLLENIGATLEPGLFFRLSTVITLVGGTIFLMWLGEQITARGVGNGISLIIFSGIVAELPSALVGTLELGRQGAISTFLIVFLMFMVIAVIAFIVFMERAQRRLLVQYPRRQMGQINDERSHLPLKLNTAGVIPPIFASALLLFPFTIAGFGAGTNSGWLTDLTSIVAPGQPVYMALYAGGIAFFAFFYTALVFNPNDTAENLRKYGGFLPGIRPGQPTAEYIDYVLTRITVVGALYLVIVCLLPEFLIANYRVPFYFGGTSLLIVVNVTLDTIGQVQSHMLAHQYEGLIKKSKLRGGGPIMRRRRGR